MPTKYEIDGALKYFLKPLSETQLESVAKTLMYAVKENPTKELVDAVAHGLANVPGHWVGRYSSTPYLAEAVAPHLSEEQADAILDARWRLYGPAIASSAPKISPQAQMRFVNALKADRPSFDDNIYDRTRTLGVLVERDDLSPAVIDAALDGGFSNTLASGSTIQKVVERQIGYAKNLSPAHIDRMVAEGKMQSLASVLDNNYDPPVTPEHLSKMHQLAVGNKESADSRSLIYSLGKTDRRLPPEVLDAIVKDRPQVVINRPDLNEAQARHVRDTHFMQGGGSQTFTENNHHFFSPEELEQMMFAHTPSAPFVLSKLPIERVQAIAKMKGIQPELKAHAKDELTWRNPDAVHKERINVAFGTNKLRILRDKIGELGSDQATPKELPRELVQAIGTTGRLPNGNYSARLLQQAIDAQPRTAFNISHSKWGGAQRHSQEDSKVFQLNLTTEMAQKLKDAGVYDTYRKLWDRSNSGSHPIGKPGIGWVRWTGSAKDGIHIDELQSDFGQRLSRMVEEQAQQAREQGYTEEQIQAELAQIKKDFPEQDIDKINEIVFGGKHSSHVLMEAFHEWARTHQAEVKSVTTPPKRKWGERKKSVEEKLFEIDYVNATEWYNGPEGQAWRAANPKKAEKLEALDDIFGRTHHKPFHSEDRQRDVAAFAMHWQEITGQTHLDSTMERYRPKAAAIKKRTPKVYESLVGAKVATWQPETKAPISGLQPDKPLPKHIVVGHRDVPEKMGFRPSIYGNLGTQKGSFGGGHGREFYQTTGRDATKGLGPEHVFTDVGYDGAPTKVPTGAPTMEEEIRKSEGFLEAVLGAPAAQALLKTAERSPVMASAMLPRAVIAWLDFASRWPYDGNIPGCENTHITFAKSESGYVGAISADGQSYEFKDSSMLEVAAAVGVVLGWDTVQPSERLTKAQVDAVGTQLDLLVKATFLAKAGKVGHDKPGAPAAPMQNTKPKEAGFDAPKPPQKGAKRNLFQSEKCDKCGEKCKCGKKTRKIKVSKAEALSTCSVCGAAQWDSGDLTLCHCLRELKKSVKSTVSPNSDHYVVEFGSSWGDSDIQVFLDIIHGDSNG